MAARRFRTRPVEIEAMRYDGQWSTYVEINAWTDGAFDIIVERGKEQKVTQMLDDAMLYGPDKMQAKVYDRLHDTWVNVSVGDWIIRGLEGEYYPCVDSTFRAKYEDASSVESYRCDFDCGYCHVDEDD